MRVLAIAALWLLSSLPGHAAEAVCAGQSYRANGHNYCSKHWVATGTCDGLDQLPIKAQPWEDRPISIVGVSVGLITHPPTKMAYAFAGNSYVHDIMALQIGAGVKTVMYPPGMSFQLPAKKEPQSPHYHVDAHVSCSPVRRGLRHLAGADTGAAGYQVWLVVYYTIP